MQMGNVLALLVAWLLGIAFVLGVFYLIVRAAVRSGVRSAVKDSLTDPATKIAFREIVDRATDDR